jgi:ketopantoate reductase
MTTPRDAILNAFDQLFETAIVRLNVSCTPEERSQARAAFAERMTPVLEVADKAGDLEVPAEAVDEMRKTIDRLSPAEVAGLVASIPLAQHAQEMLKTIAFERARQQLLMHLTEQAEPSPYGGH